MTKRHLDTHNFAFDAVEARPEDERVGRLLAQQVVTLGGFPSWSDFDGLNTAAPTQWDPLIFLRVLIENSIIKTGLQLRILIVNWVELLITTWTFLHFKLNQLQLIQLFLTKCHNSVVMTNAEQRNSLVDTVVTINPEQVTFCSNVSR